MDAYGFPIGSYRVSMDFYRVRLEIAMYFYGFPIYPHMSYLKTFTALIIKHFLGNQSFTLKFDRVIYHLRWELIGNCAIKLGNYQDIKHLRWEINRK